MNLIFSSIQIESWRQYSSIDIKFHPELTIITGPNGTGKSTILSILNRHFGYNKPYLSTFKKNKKTGILSYSSGIFKSIFGLNSPAISQNSNESEIGTIRYSNELKSNITIPKQNSVQYKVNIQNQQNIGGIHIDSHRPPSIYRNVPNIPTSSMAKSSIVNHLNSELQTYYNSGQSPNGTLFHIKTALISMSMFGYGNQTMEPNQELIDLFHGFEEKLKIILPKSLGFEKIIIRMPEVLISTKSGEFVLDAASGGIIKLFEIAWQLYFFSQQKDKFVVTMDEPENHLHPSMQRIFLRDLKTAFPMVQFIVVTHSPFVVSSVKDSSVYVIRYEDIDGIVDEVESEDQSIKGLQGVRVRSEKLDTINKAGTATEILREALGVPTTIPDWAEDRVQEIMNEYQNMELTEDLMKKLTEQFLKEGLMTRFPEIVGMLTRNNND